MLIMKNPIVEIKNLSFSYNGKKVLENINLDIMPKDFIAMIGPNGGGKTTLLKLILGLIRPDQGIIKSQFAINSSTSIGYVPQNILVNQNFPINVMDIVLMGKENKKKRFWHNLNNNKKEAQQALERLEMDKYANKKINELSGGQLQRVYIARALVTKPKLMLLDEPSSNLDTKGKKKLFQLLELLNKDITIVIVSHDFFLISKYIKSAVCLNKNLHYHSHKELTGSVLENIYDCSVEEVCSVQCKPNSKQG